MQKELKDYLHLYLWCKVQFKFITRVGKVELRTGRLFGIKGGYCRLETNYGFEEQKIEDVKLFLRPLSDMTEEEAELFQIKRMWKDCKIGFSQWDELTVTPQQMVILLSKHFDLFGLIEAGLAIDKATLTSITA